MRWLIVLVGVLAFAGAGFALLGPPGLAAGLLALLPAGRRKLQEARAEGGLEQAKIDSAAADRAKRKLELTLKESQAREDKDVAEMAEHAAEREGKPVDAAERERLTKRWGK